MTAPLTLNREKDDSIDEWRITVTIDNVEILGTVDTYDTTSKVVSVRWDGDASPETAEGTAYTLSIAYAYCDEARCSDHQSAEACPQDSCTWTDAGGPLEGQMTGPLRLADSVTETDLYGWVITVTVGDLDVTGVIQQYDAESKELGSVDWRGEEEPETTEGTEYTISRSAVCGSPCRDHGNDC